LARARRACDAGWVGWDGVHETIPHAARAERRRGDVAPKFPAMDHTTAIAIVGRRGSWREIFG